MLMSIQLKNKLNVKKRKSYGLSEDRAEMLLESNQSSKSGFISEEEREKTKTSF